MLRVVAFGSVEESGDDRWGRGELLRIFFDELSDVGLVGQQFEGTMPVFESLLGGFFVLAIVDIEHHICHADPVEGLVTVLVELIGFAV